ncbi:hypothetical protein Mal35_15250 [Gimesia maris]|uniref:hypothetical protein n=1 Tax=Gimesia maris TaxID=122 RepID=UPI00118C8903|nr:hypothetical protein [Gimesia maris]QDT78094.1 hypothetical protein Mal35_15250 [Gimesia maris]
MSKQIGYPRATLKNCLQLAKAVDELGGDCSTELAADKLNKKMGGAYQALIASAVKYRLILNKRGQLEVDQLFRDYKLAYSAEDEKRALRKAFLSPPVFDDVYQKFSGKALPVSHFEKLLIREYGVPDPMGSRVAKYFIEGAKQCGLLGADNKLEAEGAVSEDLPSFDESDSEAEIGGEIVGSEIWSGALDPNSVEEGKFSVLIKGPGINSNIVVNEVDDLLIVDAMLRKVKKSFEAGDQG